MRASWMNYSVVAASLVLTGQAGAVVILRSLGTGSEGNLTEIGTFSINSSGHKDVTGLNLVVRGGTSDDEVVSVFGNDFGAGNFRIHSLKIEVISIDGGAL